VKLVSILYDLWEMTVSLHEIANFLHARTFPFYTYNKGDFFKMLFQLYALVVQCVRRRHNSVDCLMMRLTVYADSFTPNFTSSSVSYTKAAFRLWQDCAFHLTSPADAQQQHGGLYVLLPFLIFTDSFQTNYLNIYRTDPRQICRVVRTVAVDDQFEISFSIAQGTLLWQSIWLYLQNGVPVTFGIWR